MLRRLVLLVKVGDRLDTCGTFSGEDIHRSFTPVQQIMALFVLRCY